MISPEVLRRYPFFSFMNHDQLREVAMITDEVKHEKDDVLFNNDEKADACYLLMNGSIDLHYVVVDEHDPSLRKEFIVGTINPGELLGISAFVEPHIYTATAIVVNDSRLLKMDAVALRDLCRQDLQLNLGFQTMAAKATLERLHATRVQLAAATSPE
ncbi:MAG: cyclic nucleotide-binding domain-containing protein [Chloroflexota bacterium]|jgi:CRP-like cAMP-binding protein